MSSQWNLNMRLCSRLQYAFLCVETTVQTQQEYICYWIAEQQVISCRYKQQRGRNFASTKSLTQDTS